MKGKDVAKLLTKTVWKMIPPQYKYTIIGVFVCGFLMFILIIGIISAAVYELQINNDDTENSGDVIPPGDMLAIYPFYDNSFVVTSEWGMRNGKFHEGMDFVAYEGCPIYAVADGVVVQDKVDPEGYGNYVTIQHENGYYTRYAHMEDNSVTVNVGDEVTQGTQIGTMGNTGRSTGPHLHFEFRKDSGFESSGSLDPRLLYPDLPPPYVPVVPVIPPPVEEPAPPES